LVLCFFLQAEDGIRDFHVTGVQTCALPILKLIIKYSFLTISSSLITLDVLSVPEDIIISDIKSIKFISKISSKLWPKFRLLFARSEERRVGKGSGPTGPQDNVETDRLAWFA